MHTHGSSPCYLCDHGFPDACIFHDKAPYDAELWLKLHQTMRNVLVNPTRRSESCVDDEGIECKDDDSVGCDPITVARVIAELEIIKPAETSSTTQGVRKKQNRRARYKASRLRKQRGIRPLKK